MRLILWIDKPQGLELRYSMSLRSWFDIDGQNLRKGNIFFDFLITIHKQTTHVIILWQPNFQFSREKHVKKMDRPSKTKVTRSGLKNVASRPRFSILGILVTLDRISFFRFDSTRSANRFTSQAVPLSNSLNFSKAIHLQAIGN